MKGRTISPRHARVMEWCAGFLVALYFLTCILDACRGRWVEVSIDVFGVGVGLVITALIERHVNQDADALAALMMKLPEGRRQGLRQFLQADDDR